MAGKKKNTILKDSLILFLITAVAGLLLAFVNEITKGPIEEQRLNAKAEACQAVFPDAVTFDEADETFFAGVNTFQWDNTYTKMTIDNVYLAKDVTGALIGYVINISTKEGYGGGISICMGIRNDKTINGISVLSSNETVGLGLEADKVLCPQFANKNEDSYVYTKTGATAPNEIDAISSATITTDAFVNMVNAGLAYFEVITVGGGN